MKSLYIQVPVDEPLCWENRMSYQDFGLLTKARCFAFKLGSIPSDKSLFWTMMDQGSQTKQDRSIIDKYFCDFDALAEEHKAIIKSEYPKLTDYKGRLFCPDIIEQVGNLKISKGDNPGYKKGMSKIDRAGVFVDQITKIIRDNPQTCFIGEISLEKVISMLNIWNWAKLIPITEKAAKTKPEINLDNTIFNIEWSESFLKKIGLSKNDKDKN